MNELRKVLLVLAVTATVISTAKLMVEGAPRASLAPASSPHLNFSAPTMSLNVAKTTTQTPAEKQSFVERAKVALNDAIKSIFDNSSSVMPKLNKTTTTQKPISRPQLQTEAPRPAPTTESTSKTKNMTATTTSKPNRTDAIVPTTITTTKMPTLIPIIPKPANNSAKQRQKLSLIEPSNLLKMPENRPFEMYADLFDALFKTLTAINRSAASADKDAAALGANSSSSSSISLPPFGLIRPARVATIPDGHHHNHQLETNESDYMAADIDNDADLDLLRQSQRLSKLMQKRRYPKASPNNNDTSSTNLDDSEHNVHLLCRLLHEHLQMSNATTTTTSTAIPLTTTTTTATTTTTKATTTSDDDAFVVHDDDDLHELYPSSLIKSSFVSLKRQRQGAAVDELDATTSLALVEQLTELRQTILPNLFVAAKLKKLADELDSNSGGDESSQHQPSFVIKEWKEAWSVSTRQLHIVYWLLERRGEQKSKSTPKNAYRVVGAREARELLARLSDSELDAELSNHRLGAVKLIASFKINGGGTVIDGDEQWQPKATTSSTITTTSAPQTDPNNHNKPTVGAFGHLIERLGADSDGWQLHVAVLAVILVVFIVLFAVPLIWHKRRQQPAANNQWASSQYDRQPPLSAQRESPARSNLIADSNDNTGHLRRQLSGDSRANLDQFWRQLTPNELVAVKLAQGQHRETVPSGSEKLVPLDTVEVRGIRPTEEIAQDSYNQFDNHDRHYVNQHQMLQMPRTARPQRALRVEASFERRRNSNQVGGGTDKATPSCCPAASSSSGTQTQTPTTTITTSPSIHRIDATAGASVERIRAELARVEQLDARRLAAAAGAKLRTDPQTAYKRLDNRTDDNV